MRRPCAAGGGTAPSRRPSNGPARADAPRLDLAEDDASAVARDRSISPQRVRWLRARIAKPRRSRCSAARLLAERGRGDGAGRRTRRETLARAGSHRIRDFASNLAAIRHDAPGAENRCKARACTCTSALIACRSCSPASSRSPSTASTRGRCGSRSTSARACRPSASSGSPTRRCARRASASARRSSTPGFEFPRAPDHREPRAGAPAQGRARASTPRSPSACSPPAASARPKGSTARRLRRALARRRAAARARRARGRRGRARAPASRVSSSRASARPRRRWSTASRSSGVDDLRERRRAAGRRRAAAAAAAGAGGAAPARRRAPDLADVRGHELPLRALEIAAAGGHNLLLEGPPGSGKTMLARRLPSLLPPLTREEALEVTRIHSVAGRAPPRRAGRASGRSARRTTRSRRRGSWAAGRRRRPARRRLAHHGVLFLDELSEFPRPSLEALRQPIEDGHVVGRARAAGAALPDPLHARRRDEPVSVRLCRQRAPVPLRRARAGAPSAPAQRSAAGPPRPARDGRAPERRRAARAG